MFKDIEKTIYEFVKCDMGIHETYQDINELEAIDIFWENLSHEKKINFLTSLFKCYFYYPKEWKVFREKPSFPQYSKLKKMQIAFEEFRIVIELILKNNLNGRNVEEIILATRKDGFDEDFKEMLEKNPIIPTFLPKSFTVQLVNGYNNEIDNEIQNEVIFNKKLMNTVKSYEELIEKIEYYIYIAYYHFVAKYTNSQIVKVINENLTSSVLKYNSDIKRILGEKDKKNFFMQLIEKSKIELDKNL